MDSPKYKIQSIKIDGIDSMHCRLHLNGVGRVFIADFHWIAHREIYDFLLHLNITVGDRGWEGVCTIDRGRPIVSAVSGVNALKHYIYT